MSRIIFLRTTSFRVTELNNFEMGEVGFFDYGSHPIDFANWSRSIYFGN